MVFSFSSARLFTILTCRYVEHSVWRAWRTVWTEAHVVWIVFHGGKHFFRWCESIAGHIVLCDDFLFEWQWQQAAQIFVVQMQCGIFGDVWRENGTVSAVQMVAGWRWPMWQIFDAIIFVNNTKLCDIIDARKNGYTILDQTRKQITKNNTNQ